MIIRPRIRIKATKAPKIPFFENSDVLNKFIYYGVEQLVSGHSIFTFCGAAGVGQALGVGVVQVIVKVSVEELPFLL